MAIVIIAKAKYQCHLPCAKKNVHDGKGPTSNLCLVDIRAKADRHARVDGVEEALRDWPIVIPCIE